MYSLFRVEGWYSLCFSHHYLIDGTRVVGGGLNNIVCRLTARADTGGRSWLGKHPWPLGHIKEEVTGRVGRAELTVDIMTGCCSAGLVTGAVDDHPQRVWRS